MKEPELTDGLIGFDLGFKEGRTQALADVMKIIDKCKKWKGNSDKISKKELKAKLQSPQNETAIIRAIKSTSNKRDGSSEDTIPIKDVMKIIDEIHKDLYKNSADNCSATRCGYRELKAKLQEQKA